MSSLQKLFIGPANTVSCRSCGKGVTVRWRHFIWLLVPAALVLFGMRLLKLEPTTIALIGIPFAIAIFYAQLRLVPLAPDRF